MKFKYLETFEQKTGKILESKGLNAAINHIAQIHAEIDTKEELSAYENELLNKYPEINKRSLDGFISVAYRAGGFQKYSYNTDGETGSIVAKGWRDFFNKISEMEFNQITVLRKNI